MTLRAKKYIEVMIPKQSLPVCIHVLRGRIHRSKTERIVCVRENVRYISYQRIRREGGVRVRLDKGLVALDRGIDDLRNAAPVREAANEAVLGGIVLVLILADLQKAKHCFRHINTLKMLRHYVNAMSR